MYLYLVQHGESKSKDQDPERSLTDAGLAAVKQMATFAREKARLKLTTITHSGKRRAEQTAELIAEQLDPKPRVTPVNDLAPNDDPGIWVERLNLMDDDVMLVGHLPHLSRLASALIAGDADKPVVSFRNAGIVCLVKADDGSWTVRFQVNPEMV